MPRASRLSRIRNRSSRWDSGGRNRAWALLFRCRIGASIGHFELYDEMHSVFERGSM